MYMHKRVYTFLIQLLLKKIATWLRQRRFYTFCQQYRKTHLDVKLDSARRLYTVTAESMSYSVAPSTQPYTKK